MSFTAINIPEFPVVAWQLTEKQDATPCVLLDGVPPQQTVVSLCRHAQAAGLEHGMSRAQAEAGYPARFRRREPEEELAAYAAVAEIAENFSPRVEALAQPGNRYAGASRLHLLLLLDSSGTGSLFGPAESYAEQLHTRLRAAGFPAGVASAPNAEAALLLARSTERVVCADPESVCARLAVLPVSLLPCAPASLLTLDRWGIRTLGELAALPEAALVSRLGQAGRRLQQLARGEAEHLLVPEEPEFTLTETVVLDSPVELLESLLFVISPLLEAVLRRARERAYALRAVKLLLGLERGSPHLVEIRPATPTGSRELLLKLFNLELQAHPPASGIVAITLEAEPAQPMVAQRGLFQSQFPDPDRLDLLLARLRSVAGDGNVGSPALQNRHGEDRFTVKSFRPSPEPASEQEPVPCRLAIRRLRPPQPVRVALQDQQPRTLFWGGARLMVTAAAGPWHSSGSWWDGEAWDHNLWDVVLAEPVQALRLRQDHSSQAWTVVGLYD